MNEQRDIFQTAGIRAATARTIKLCACWLLASLTTLLIAQADPIRVACVGDSITAGVGVANSALDAYPAVLGRMLGPDSSPVAMRYGWVNVPDVNLFNQARFPASPFRSNWKEAAKTP